MKLGSEKLLKWYKKVSKDLRYSQSSDSKIGKDPNPNAPRSLKNAICIENVTIAQHFTRIFGFCQDRQATYNKIQCLYKLPGTSVPNTVPDPNIVEHCETEFLLHKGVFPRIISCLNLMMASL